MHNIITTSHEQKINHTLMVHSKHESVWKFSVIITEQRYCCKTKTSDTLRTAAKMARIMVCMLLMWKKCT